MGLGTLIPMLIGRDADIVTTGVTTMAVMVVAGLAPTDAREQPVLRVVDSAVAIAVGRRAVVRDGELDHDGSAPRPRKSVQAAAGGPRVPASWNLVIPDSGQAERALAAMPRGPRGATLTPAEPTGERRFR